jgi:hypothetical protein
MERADLWMSWCVERVRAWRRVRLEPGPDRHLLPWATEALAADTRTLDRLERSVPWMLHVDGRNPRSVGGPGQRAVHAPSAPRGADAVVALCSRPWPGALLEPGEPVKAGALLLYDRGYLHVSCFDQRSARGRWWMSCDTNRVTSQIVPVCSQGQRVFAAIVHLGPSQGVPATFPVHDHRKPSRAVTTALDPRRLPLAEVGKR